MKRFIFLFSFLLLFTGAYSQKQQKNNGGYATVRVFDCNKAVGMGSGYIFAKIYIVYEDGTTEEMDLLPFSEKNEIENLKTVNKLINQMKNKGYFLISQYTTGEQGNLVTDYTFLKQQ